jgi:hypothetical protein
METKNETRNLALVSRAIALGLAFATTSAIAGSVGALFSVQPQSIGGALAELAFLPIRAILGS